MKIQVTITRTDSGANTNVKSNNGEANRDYQSWHDALTDAEQLGLISAVESIAANALPPGFPLHTSGDTEPQELTKHGFVLGKASPPQ